MLAIAVVPQGLEVEASNELVALGAQGVRPLRRSVAFEADLSCFYRLHLFARLPFRLLRQVASFQCDGPKSLYRGIQSALDWERWLHPSMSFRVDVSGHSDALTHSHFTALQVKNALVDLQRNIWSDRSHIDLKKPDMCFHLHLNQSGAVLSLDGSGGSLHRRGYRAAMGLAPLKENLAAGLIRITGWDGKVPLVDPLCGSGTLLIEAVGAFMGLAPGVRRSFSFENWYDFDPVLWDKEKQRANTINQSSNRKKLPLIIGCEQKINIAKQAQANIEAAGLQNIIKIKNSNFHDLVLPNQPGFIVCNPPYGKRIGVDQNLQLLYKELGDFIKKNASGWQLWLLNGNQELSSSLGMKAARRYPISNGGIDCRWLQYQIY